MTAPPRRLDWPRWATWATLAAIASAMVTVAATLNDIW